MANRLFDHEDFERNAPRATTPLLPPAPAVPTHGEVERATLDLLPFIFAGAGEHDFAVRLWEGSVWQPSPERTPLFTLVLNHPGALRQMFLPPSQLSMGEAFVRGDFDVAGDLVAATALGESLETLLADARRWPYLLRRLLALPRCDDACQANWRGAVHLDGAVHSPSRDRRAISYHYDLPCAFYGLFLDRNMQYSCAYFATGAETLDAAQAAKMDHICRKLMLQPGDRLLDVGCGWGGLILYAAAHYGVEAVGITLSRPQAEWARQRIAAAGLEKRCRVEIRDYREMDEWERFDKIVSVGMFEHVGQKNLPIYFERALNLLRPGGLFLNHGIAAMFRPAPGPLAALTQRALNLKGDFMRRYVFPDTELVPIYVSTTAAELVGFEVRDVESLREHYALTLRHWLRALADRHDDALQLVDEWTYRVWRLYIAGCAHAFDAANISIYQSLLVKPERQGRSGMPWTRAHLYEHARPPAGRGG